MTAETQGRTAGDARISSDAVRCGCGPFTARTNARLYATPPPSK